MSSWWKTVELTECSRTSEEKADSSSNMLSWYDKIIWTNRVQLSWQFAAVVTMCSWADKLHVSQLIAAELTNCSWAELMYSSWGDISRVLEGLEDNWSMSFVDPHVAFLVMWGVACLLPCYPSAAVNNQPSCVSCQVITKKSCSMFSEAGWQFQLVESCQQASWLHIADELIHCKGWRPYSTLITNTSSSCPRFGADHVPQILVLMHHVGHTMWSSMWRSEYFSVIEYLKSSGFRNCLDSQATLKIFASLFWKTRNVLNI